MFWYRCDEGSSHHFSYREHASRAIIYTSMKFIRAHRASLLEKLFGLRMYARLSRLSPRSRARSLRNLLVSGNECGRVFPAGVGPGSPSRDAANWLPSRFSLSVETRRRYGWLRMMVFPGARLFPSPNLVAFGRVAARERQGALSRRAW